jgi:hypothetical protein
MVLKLRKDKDLRRRLLLKLAEYGERLHNPGEPIGRLRCKIFVLWTLLAEGSVTLRDLGKELQQGDFYTDIRYLPGVFNLVWDYAWNDGSNVSGGTGLPKVA